MPHFVLNENAQTEGKHKGQRELHNLSVGKEKGCLPDDINQIHLFERPSCREAVLLARAIYPDWSINGCAYCAPECDEG
ncbi:hypothetical protein [Candidatus Poriferisocius sp.]|uniref:hypothetical protein n=1 Tax=Candidatus Poriferisocius sp. TaxID=3101276 RepID=UPI003B01951A